ncbi:unnamed protein product [Rotaria socialis]|uniref:Uncharacterized protein n=1 Tax=Rotaria socialis TaxID=392032 RepID=A0A818Z7T4_9BILA|nr:unnamed protein product [Rotaria socialis]
MGCNSSKYATASVVVNQSSVASAIDIQQNSPPISIDETRFGSTITSITAIDHGQVNLESHQLQYLENSKDHSNTFLVIAGQLGETLIPNVDRLGNILIIYVYCHDKEYHQQWASNYQ